MALALVVAATLTGGCGQDGGAMATSGNGSGSGDPERELSPPPADLPPALSDLRSQASELLDGGPVAFKDRLAELRGYPVIVNKWASWCAPCRAEFPFFQAQAERLQGEVAFLGVNSSDDAGNAAAFLGELPVPYPSYSDPDLEIADVFNGVAAFPTTAFYDSGGELVYVKQGGYATEEQLAEDIERYATG